MAGKPDSGTQGSAGQRAPRAAGQAQGRAAGSQRLIAGAMVHAQIADDIGRRIVQGEFPEGSILPNEAQWGENFGVSRTAVREAIKMLMAKGLLSSRPKIGSRVEQRENWNLFDRDVLGWYAESPHRADYLRSVQEFRHIIEPEAAALAAARRNDDQMREISQACADMGTAASLALRSKADMRFHVAILRAAGNDLLLPLGVLISSALENLFVHVTREANDLRHAQDMHEDIEKQIRLQKPEAARKAVKRLLGNTDLFVQKGKPSG
ncbi:FadR/GntR family transcriptional regulator [Neogemmobacter tilapiae]|uniref:GntR family transcriptional regulator n=1 Tax=Neogemmobacter tilapiae TaxID=875041 RepID=A0A918WLJ2_9RHOB|nr:FadR/GntR family transcriptional regulator [Gemmobacter tilapiae]GHC54150.1 GntR family transcriptional regulator [Gemmobacter tilapiae]